MPEADDEQEGARRLAVIAFTELSRRDRSFSSAQPPADHHQLLRLCILSLRFLHTADSDLEFRCCSRLLASLRGVLSREPGPSLLPALEVFLENLVVSGQLRWYLAVTDAATPIRSRVTSAGSRCRGGHLIVMELMSHHFISSAQDEEGFLSALSWSGTAKLEIPEIGFMEALCLLRRSYLLSFTAAVQAHFLLLACRCVRDGDLEMQLLAFQHAMNVYLRYLPALDVFKRTNSVNSPSSCFIKKRPLKSCIQGATHQKVACQISRLVGFCQLHSSDDLPINESDIFDASVHFIEENQQVVHEQFRQEIITIMKSIVSTVLCWAKQKEMDKLDTTVSEGIICLAASLRLMGSSFLRMMHGIMQMTVADASQNRKSFETSKLYTFVSETIHSLEQYEANELQRPDLFDMIGKHMDIKRCSVVMLSHFASLLVHCLRMRFGFMWKGCIFMMIMAVNLVVIEEHSMDLFHFLIDRSKEYAICRTAHTGQDTSLKGSVPRKSSMAIALRFNNIKKGRNQGEVGHNFGEGCSSDILQRCRRRDERDEVRAFMECLPGHRQNSSGYSDILDYIECKPGLDYSNWWTQRKKFKMFKNNKWIRSKRHYLYKRKMLLTPMRGSECERKNRR